MPSLFRLPVRRQHTSVDVRKEIREVERLLEEHREQRCALRLPPFSGEALEAVTRSFRQRGDDGAVWSDIHALQDKLRDAEDALERAQAEAARADHEARVRYTMDAIEHAQGPVAFPLDGAGRIEAAKQAIAELLAKMKSRT